MPITQNQVRPESENRDAAARRDVAKLISGPLVFICDGCVGDAAAVASHVLRSPPRLG
jgi:hypothetical protein